MKKAILTVLGVAVVFIPLAMKMSAQSSKAAVYITKEEVDTVNKTPGVDRTLRVVDIGHEHFSVGIIHRGATGGAARGAAARFVTIGFGVSSSGCGWGSTPRKRAAGW
jgi:hypothetical protein